MKNNWICCQLGAREHYAIPRALHASGDLAHLITDAWVQPNSLINKLPISSLKSLGDRHHPDLVTAPVHAFNNQLILFETQQRLLKSKAWGRMIARNDWFQGQVIQTLKRLNPYLSKLEKTPILFAYSYAALEILKYAKTQGWITVLGQIDPGIEEEKIVIEEYQQYPNLAPDWQPVPSEYWHNWQQECQLADKILVNSNWSKKLLTMGNIDAKKIEIIPLVYQSSQEQSKFQRIYPQIFSDDRPLRVLFLGLITLRKGISLCLEAIKKLENQPIEFWFVGSQQIRIPDFFKNHPRIHWIEAVPRSQTYQYYQQADVFLFPTLSDGFGLTQLEAQAWQLPIIASRKCGEVVRDGINGLLLQEGTASEIVECLLMLKNNPRKLQDLSERAIQNDDYSIKKLIIGLNSIL